MRRTYWACFIKLLGVEGWKSQYERGSETLASCSHDDRLLKSCFASKQGDWLKKIPHWFHFCNQCVCVRENCSTSSLPSFQLCFVAWFVRASINLDAFTHCDPDHKTAFKAVCTLCCTRLSHLLQFMRVGSPLTSLNWPLFLTTNKTVA